jgi:hypothetical protein
MLVNAQLKLGANLSRLNDAEKRELQPGEENAMKSASRL